MSVEAGQRLGLASRALASGLVEALGADQREGDIAVEQRVVREVDALLPTLAEESTYVVAARGEGVGRGGCRLRRDGWRGLGYDRRPRGAGTARSLDGREQSKRVFIVRVHCEHAVRTLLDDLTVVAAQQPLLPRRGTGRSAAAVVPWAWPRESYATVNGTRAGACSRSENGERHTQYPALIAATSLEGSSRYACRACLSQPNGAAATSAGGGSRGRCSGPRRLAPCSGNMRSRPRKTGVPAPADRRPRRTGCPCSTP